MRWPFGPPRLPLNPPKTKTKTNNPPKKHEKHKNTKKMSLSVISIIFLVGGRGPEFPFFDNLAQKARTQKHYNNKGFSKPIFQKQRTVTKKCWNPYFIVF